MCGIFGAVWSAQHANLFPEQALAALRHRGPDGQRALRFKGGCFGHTRLAVVDLSEAADQPMLTADSQLIVVFNGQIYNHRLLRTELESHGHRFRTDHSDTEVILHGYRQWGEGVLQRLRGMFAFGLFDMSTKTLFLARDHCGKKPLFWWHQAGELRFASEIKGLAASGLTLRPRDNALFSLLCAGYVEGEKTLYEGVNQLRPGTCLRLQENHKPEVRAYWLPRYTVDTRVMGSVSPRSYEKAKEQLRDGLDKAVQKRLDADVPIGAFLSGGIDSSIVCALMARHQKVYSFSIGFEGDARYDETRFAQQVADRHGLMHTVFTVRPDAINLMPTLIRLYDGPFGDSSALPTYLLSSLTRQHVTVALSGDGGDELFCGYSRFIAAEWAERMPRFWIRLARQVLRGFECLGDDRKSFINRASRFVTSAQKPLVERLVDWIAVFRPQEALKLLGEKPEHPPAEFYQFMAWHDESASDASGDRRGMSALQQILCHNFRTYLPYDLLVKMDRASMAHGLEVRSPFLDIELLEWSAALSTHWLRRGRRRKRILIDAFSDILPRAVWDRPKMGFGVPLGAWFRGPLRDQTLDLAQSSELVDFDKGVRTRIVKEHLEGRADHGHKLWLLTSIDQWKRMLRARDFWPVARADAGSVYEVTR